MDAPAPRPIELPPPPVAVGSPWRVHVYAHTHWDREWYRSHERFRMQLVGVVDRVLQVLDRDPAFSCFVLDGQAIVLDDYLAIRPQELPRLRRLVGAGRLEAGPWYVLPDEFLVSGEALVRNLLEGRRAVSRLGPPLDVGYLPDPFGHVAQLPAVLRGFGIDNVVLSRGMGDEHVRLGDEFRWEALDGTDVLAIVQGSPRTSGYCNAEQLASGDAGGIAHVLELVEHLARSDRTGTLLVAAGSDHETVRQDLPGAVERIGELLPGADVRLTGLAGHVRAVREAERRVEAGGGALERYRGELRGSRYRPILSSILSARVPVKQRNDALQALLERHVEPLMAAAVAAGVRPLRDVQPFLQHAWRLVLENHPHDSIGGCSIDDVHLEMQARSLRAEAVARGLVEDLRIAMGVGDAPVVHDGEGLGGIAERGDGSPVALRGGAPGELVELDRLLEPDGGRVDGDAAVVAGELRAEVLDGALVVSHGGRSVRLDWIDEADAGDEYDFGRVEGDEPLVAQLVAASAHAAGPGVAELVVEHRFELPRALAPDRRGRSTERVEQLVRTRVRVSPASPLAQLVVELDNRADDHRLRLRAAVDGFAPDDRVQALGHFAIVERPVRPRPPEAPWRQAPTGSNHCAGAVRAGGVLLAGRGIHEYEARAGLLELTVLRCVGWLSRDDVAGRPGHAGPALATPGAQCRGPIRVDLAVGIGDLASFEAARAFLAPPLLLEPFAATGVTAEPGALARARDVLASTPPGARERIDALGLRLGGEGVMPSACKLADDGSGDLVVRWWAPSSPDEAPVARLRLAAPVRAVHRARLDETKLGPAPFADGACAVRVPPGGIVTLRIELDAA